MELLATLYILGAVIAIGAGIPQIRQLLAVRNSDEFELSTWLAWLGTQVISLAYVISLRQVLLAIVSACWVIFYAVMVGLIIHFKPRAVWRLKLPQTEATISLERKP